MIVSTSSTDRHRTPDQILGPYFPVGCTPLRKHDLTTIEGGDGVAQGEIIEVMGRVLNLDGEPVRGVPVTIWQASFGRYVHVNDPNPAPLDPYFVGCVGIRSDSDGVYRINADNDGDALADVEPREELARRRVQTSRR